MLKRKHLFKNFEVIWRSMVTHFYAFVETQNVEDLHHLRIEIKKIFALAALLEFSTDSFVFSECLKPLKAIFMKAGEIRNIQLALRAIMRYAGKKSSLYEVQQAILINLINLFCLKTDLFARKIKKVHESVLPKICDIENGSISSWFEKELLAVEMFFAKKSSRENMHEGRKILKKLLYVYEILHKPIQDKLRLNKHYLNKLQEAIGKWHDATVSMVILSRSNVACDETVKKLSDRKQKLSNLCCALSKSFSKESVTLVRL